MSNYTVIIPARGGSKGILRKNIKTFCGKPLIYWVCKAAQDCNKINQIIVSTESQEIKDVVKSFGFDKIIIHNRSNYTARDEATTREVIIEVVNYYTDFEKIILLQTTSPLTTNIDLEFAIREFEKNKYEALCSGVLTHSFYYTFFRKNNIKCVNANQLYRKRRQDWKGLFQENGAIYIFGKKMFLKNKSYFSKKKQGFFVMDKYSKFEIDTIEDWNILENIFRKINGGVNG